MSQKSSKAQRLIAELKGKDHLKVLFVCLGNICRSPAAEGVMRDIVEQAGEDDRWTIDSAGTGNYHIGDLPDNRMRIHARHRGYELTHRCRQVRVSDFDEFDLIIAMDASNERNLRQLAPTVETADKVVQMANWVDMAMRYDYIPDPYYEGAEGFELVLDLLQNACQNLFDDLK
jgi:protein-tyrosine phosphatase